MKGAIQIKFDWLTDWWTYWQIIAHMPQQQGWQQGEHNTTIPVGVCVPSWQNVVVETAIIQRWFWVLQMFICLWTDVVIMRLSPPQNFTGVLLGSKRVGPPSTSTCSQSCDTFARRSLICCWCLKCPVRKIYEALWVAINCRKGAVQIKFDWLID